MCLRGGALLVLLGSFLLLGPSLARAQFMRLGPYDLDANTSVDFVYTTNVEGERKSESEQEREDFFLVWSLRMNLAGPTTPQSDLTLSTSTSIEKHFVRDDLDTASDPFGDVLLTHNMEMGRFDLPTTLQFRRENIQDDDGTTRIYIPGQRKERVVQDTRSFSQGLNWRYEGLALSSSYRFRQLRFPDEEFEEGDEDLQTIDFRASWSFLQWRNRDVVSLFYDHRREKTELLNRPDAPGSGEWQTDQAYGLRLNILIIERPELTYSMAREKSDDQDWRTTHTFELSDEWELSPVMQLDANARYRIDEQPQEDDVLFIYSVGLSHEIGQTLRHSVRATREPVDTFGSTADTESTRIVYNISKTDLFFANVNFNGSAAWERDKPQGEDAGPTEETQTYTAGLSHSTAVSRRLSRDLSYRYRWSKSNLDDEPIYEHRVTLGFTFTF